jgi:hypothetical protein
MKTVSFSPAYITLQNQVKNQLADFLERGKMKVEEVMAILYLFSFTQTVEELQAFILLFSDSFPVLNNLAVQEEVSRKQAFDQQLAMLVQNVLKKDPQLAAHIGKEVSKKGITMEQILQKYPEVKKYM